MSGAEAEQELIRALSSIVNRWDDDIFVSRMASGSSLSASDSPSNSEKDSPVIMSIEGAANCSDRPGSGSSSLPAARQENPSLETTSVARTCSKRKRGSNDFTRDSDDKDEDEQPRRQLKPVTRGRPLSRPRFACPYQKHDPLSSFLCCMPNSKNPEGGADTFSRVNFIGLTFFETMILSSDAITAGGCRKFVASHTDNWFCLFGILLPHVPADGPNGYKNLSPSLRGLVTGRFQADEAERMEALFDELDTDAMINNLFQSAEQSGTFTNQIIVPTEARTGYEPQYQNMSATLPAAPQGPIGPSPSQLDRSMDHNVDFLRQDNSRLRNSNDQLRAEVEILRKQRGENQAQLNRLRESFRPLESSLQEMLYLPGIHSSEGGMLSRLFVILDEMTAVNKIFGSGC
ncbi:hypothetical protein GQ53DRAFT_803570 [Thozetella sp. PMI_491]|nr:hypothetical protein GQ53DRAFT_803570 [Thozetella sp. PMI_491]